ncbi:hypothetical protein BS78_10G166700 [Paspalum vaginatum]|nr:hypothetical protein BS78_10G166700 [Paspalum vaginatum]
MSTHILFGCPIAVVIWCWVRDALNWRGAPLCFQNLNVSIGPSSNMKSSGFVLIASVCWALWKTRNNWVFNNVLISNLKVVAYQIIGFVQQWMKLQASPEELQADVTMLMEGIRRW